MRYFGLAQEEYLDPAKSFDSCQPAQSAQADQSRYFLQMHKTPFFSQGKTQLFNTEKSLSFIYLCRD